MGNWRCGTAVISLRCNGLAMSGASMMLGVVVQMLSPMQGGLGRPESPDNKPSYAFGGPVNTIAQGNPVPILYGKRRSGGNIISAGIFAEDQQQSSNLTK